MALKEIEGFVIYATPMPWVMNSITFLIVPTLKQIERNTLIRIYADQTLLILKRYSKVMTRSF